MIDPLEFVAVREEVFLDHSSIHFDELKAENALLACESGDRRQELTDAMKYCIDRLKEAQVILDLQNSSETISTRSQLIGKEIWRRIMDMLCPTELTEDEEMFYYKDSSMFCTKESEESSQDMNSEEEQEKKRVSTQKRLKIPLEYYGISVPWCYGEGAHLGGYLVISEDEDFSESELSKHSVNLKLLEDESVAGNAKNNVFYLGKDKMTKWYQNAPPNIERINDNVMVVQAGTKYVAKNRREPFDCWDLFFPEQTLEEIVKHTNVELCRKREKYSRDRDYISTNLIEIKALLGLLYLGGSLKSSHLNAKNLWEISGSDAEYFRLTMSYKRFYVLMKALRFDNAQTRAERRKYDNLAAIREVFENFNSRCFDMFNIGECGVISEMVEAFKGKCIFKQYAPNKFSKYGIKIYALCDCSTFYTAKMEIHAGNQPVGPFRVSNKPEHIVKRLIQPIANSGRNITMDSRFSSLSLVDDLLKCNTTVVAMLRKNNQEVPPEFSNTKNRSVFSSLVGFRESSVLVSYVPQEKKNVILLSSKHSMCSFQSSEQRKPEILTFYNRTKDAVDVVERLKADYNVSRINCRWQLTLFFSLLDVAVINSQIIFYSNTRNIMPRQEFIQYIAKELLRPLMEIRACTQTIPKEIHEAMTMCVKVSKTGQTDIDSTRSRPKCFYCPKRKNRKTSMKCAICSQPICGEHTLYICSLCSPQRNVVVDDNLTSIP